MRKSELKIGEEYAVDLGLYATTKYRSTDRLARVKLVKIDHVRTVQVESGWSGRDTRTVQQKGLLVELVEPFDVYHAKRQTLQPGSKHFVKSGAYILVEWRTHQQNVEVRQAATERCKRELAEAQRVAEPIERLMIECNVSYGKKTSRSTIHYTFDVAELNRLLKMRVAP